MRRQHGATDFEGYQQTGLASREEILSLLPDDWSFEGKRVLDMGCGAGRTLRHFLSEAEMGELWGCDIDEPSLAWMETHLSPPVRVLRGTVDPPLPLPDGHFDLIWSISLFTHLASWAEWLAELHRLLKPGGLLIATYHGGALAGVLPPPIPWDEERAGVVIVSKGESFSDTTGPTVYWSGWWLETSWGRGFEVLEHRRTGFAGFDPGQGIVLARRRPGVITAEELERVDGSDPRQVETLRYQIEVAFGEADVLREWIRALRSSP
jgi:SAM-dependent methyltransferase